MGAKTVANDYYSPLRYPGGKGRVADYFKKVIRENHLMDGVYVEPYAGGASVALSLLMNEYVSKVVINDVDRSVYAFWHSVLNKTSAFCELVRKTKVSVPVWRKQREIQRNASKHGLLELGFSTFFLNRTNRSGILNGGVIGGLDQTGEWKIDARYNKAALIARIERIGEFRKRIQLHNSDAVDLVRELLPHLPKKTLFYFDPPYFVKGKDLYHNHYEPMDHSQVATTISRIREQFWVVTYDNVNPIRRLYKPFRKKLFSLNYSAAKASKGEEVMIFSDNLYFKKSRPVFEAAVVEAS